MNIQLTDLSSESFKSYSAYKAFALATILLDEPLEFDLYIDNGGHLVKYVKAGSMLHVNTKEKLIQNNVDHFYITAIDSKAFDHYLTNHLSTVLNAPGLDKTEKSKIIYSSAIHVMQDMFDSDVSASKIMAAKELICETVKRIVASEVKPPPRFCN